MSSFIFYLLAGGTAIKGIAMNTEKIRMLVSMQAYANRPHTFFKIKLQQFKVFCVARKFHILRFFYARITREFFTLQIILIQSRTFSPLVASKKRRKDDGKMNSKDKKDEKSE